MKRRILLFWALFTTCIISAQEIQCLIVEMNTTSETLYALSNVQRIIVGTDDIKVCTKSLTETPFLYTDFTNVSFGLRDLTTTSAKATPVSILNINPILADNNLIINNEKSCLPVYLYTLNGLLIRAAVTKENETHINIGSLQSGTYLLQVGTKKFKININKTINK